MKRIISYIPSMSIAFSIGTLAVCLINILYSDPVNRFSVGLVQFAAYIVLTVLVDIIISSIDFHHYLPHFFAEVVFDYPILLAFIYFGKWDPFKFATIRTYTILFFCVIVSTHLYAYYATKKNANELNELLKR